MLLGLRTVIYPVADLARAKLWYEQVVGAKPYFDEPFYVGFTVGGFELGLLPDATPGTSGRNPSGALRTPRPNSSGCLPLAPRNWSPSPKSAKASRSPP